MGAERYGAGDPTTSIDARILSYEKVFSAHDLARLLVALEDRYATNIAAVRAEAAEQVAVATRFKSSHEEQEAVRVLAQAWIDDGGGDLDDVDTICEFVVKEMSP